MNYNLLKGKRGIRVMTAYEKGLEEYMDENGNIIYG